jgi:hypothetical protein
MFTPGIFMSTLIDYRPLPRLLPPLRPPPCDASPPFLATSSLVCLLADAKPLFDLPLSPRLELPPFEPLGIIVNFWLENN